MKCIYKSPIYHLQDNNQYLYDIKIHIFNNENILYDIGLDHDGMQEAQVAPSCHLPLTLSFLSLNERERARI